MNQFKLVSSILVGEMDAETRDRVMTQLMAIAVPAKTTVGGKIKATKKTKAHGSASGTSKPELIKKLKEVIGLD